MQTIITQRNKIETNLLQNLYSNEKIVCDFTLILNKGNITLKQIKMPFYNIIGRVFTVKTIFNKHFQFTFRGCHLGCYHFQEVTITVVS